MSPDNEILKELSELNSPLAGFARAMPYALPDGYFTILAQALTQDVVLSESDPILQFSKAMPFAVPEGYFAALPQNMTDAALKSNVDAGVTMPYDVPNTYFASLPDTLLTAAKAADKPVQKGKTIAFRPQWQKRVAQLAAAAVLVMGIWLGSYKYMHPIGSDAAATQQLAKVDGDDINAYIEQHVDEFDTETLEASVVAANVDLQASVSTLDEEEIRDYLLDEPGNAKGEHLN